MPLIPAMKRTRGLSRSPLSRAGQTPRPPACLLAGAGLALLGGCSLSTDFDRAPPAFDARPGAAPADFATPRPDADPGPDARPTDSGDGDASPRTDAALPDAQRPEPDAEIVRLDEGPAPDAGPHRDAEVDGDPDFEVDADLPPERCVVEGARRAFPCHAGADNRFARAGATPGARRVELCRDGLWTRTVACAHPAPVACALACGDCPTDGQPMDLQPGAVHPPTTSTIDVDYRFPKSRQPLPTGVPADLIGWEVSNAYTSYTQTHTRTTRAYDAGGVLGSARWQTCSGIGAEVECGQPRSTADTRTAAGVPFVVRRNFVRDPPNRNELSSDVLRLSPEGDRVERLMHAATPAGMQPDLPNLLLGTTRTTVYGYGDPSILPLPDSLVLLDEDGQVEQRNVWSVDDRGRRIAVTAYGPEGLDGTVPVILQRQIDTSCLDCDEVGCGVSPLATECAFVGFTHWPMGICGMDGAPMLAEAAADRCRLGLNEDHADVVRAGLARLSDGGDLTRARARLARSDLPGVEARPGAWVGARLTGGIWRWDDGQQVDSELLGGGCADAEGLPEGTLLYVSPTEGLCAGAPTDRFWALCATPPDTGIGRLGPEAFNGRDAALPPRP